MLQTLTEVAALEGRVQQLGANLLSVKVRATEEPGCQQRSSTRLP